MADEPDGASKNEQPVEGSELKDGMKVSGCGVARRGHHRLALRYSPASSRVNMPEYLKSMNTTPGECGIGVGVLLP